MQSWGLLGYSIPHESDKGGLKPSELLSLSFHLVVNGQVLSQSAQYVSIPEGKNVSMSCNSSSALDNVLWYKQDPKEGLVLLVALYKSGEVVRSGKVTAEFGGTRKDSVLTLSVLEPADSSTYFCAGEHSAPQAPAV